ncbi:MAG TPA: pilus assembly protein PilP [Gammaproteobacteria bacterium]|nr:pilus assembly protein PilP [Gammaproteobacteria bacterium]
MNASGRLPARRTTLRLALLALLTLPLLAGCSRNMSDLRAYIKRVKSRHSGHVQPIPKMKPYQQYTYVAKGRSPFEPESRPTGGKSKGVSSVPPPDRNRPPQPLEKFPLDALHMVGTIQVAGVTWALVQDSNGTVHRVKKGDYMGQNYGKIVAITASKISLIEKVPDGVGGWKDRKASVALSQK